MNPLTKTVLYNLLVGKKSIAAQHRVSKEFGDYLESRGRWSYLRFKFEFFGGVIGGGQGNARTTWGGLTSGGRGFRVDMIGDKIQDYFWGE